MSFIAFSSATMVPCGFLAFLRVDRLEHLGDKLYLGLGDYAENIAVEVDDAALVLGVGKHFFHCFQHTQAFVADDELDALQAAPFKPLKEADLAGPVLFHALGSAQNLTVAVLVDRDCNQNGNVFVLAAPVSSAGRCRPHRHKGICRPAGGGCASPRCGCRLSC